MDALGLGWILAAVAVLAAAIFLFRLRRESGRAGELARDVDRLEGELHDARQRVEKRSGAERRRSDQERDTRRKLEKAKKRVSQARAEQQEEVERVRQLESQLRLREADVKGLREELARASASPLSPDRIEEREAERGEMKQALSSLTARAEKAEAAAAAAKTAKDEATSGLEKEVARLRRKTATQETLYASIRSELEIKKHRLRAQTEELERLRAYKVAVVDPVPVPVPVPDSAEDESLDPTS
jgi:chromosome segregation ATPase